jgi:Pentapeptide repeats (8 copies)
VFECFYIYGTPKILSFHNPLFSSLCIFLHLICIGAIIYSVSSYIRAIPKIFGTSFRMADLTNAKFAGATLKNVNFSGAIITGVDWTDTRSSQPSS